VFGEKFSDRKDNSRLNISDILIRVARLISINKEGVDFLKSQAFEANGQCSCKKCNGTGNIPSFAHYANGICFDCGGVGIDRHVLKSMIKNSLSLAK
jgi:DnaJ-class molecular chaperone